MKVLFLGPSGSPLVDYLRADREQVVTSTEPIVPHFLELESPDFLVSYGYRHKIPADVVARYRGRAINLHISYLPWNRGSDPNFWSWLEDTPKGVTIHYIDEGLDTGPIIAQEVVTFTPGSTLRTSYETLHASVQALFKAQWPRIRTGRCPSVPQKGRGCFHGTKDKYRFAHLLVQGWDTPVAILQYEGRRMRQEIQMTVKFNPQHESEGR